MNRYKKKFHSLWRKDHKVTQPHVIHFVLLLQDAKVREQLGVASVVGKIESRMLTVVTGTDMVNITYQNFMAFQEEVAKVSLTESDHWKPNCQYECNIDAHGLLY